MTRSELKLKLAVSGAAQTDVCCPNIAELAYSVGKAIAQHGCVTITGATSGAPLWAAKGAHENGGLVIGLSPALNEKEHLSTYSLPTDYHDIILWTGFDYTGRNMILSRVAEGVIIICGRIGTINEFTTAFEDRKPIGVLLGSGGNADELRALVEKSGRTHNAIVWEPDPEKLVSSLLSVIQSQESFEHAPNFQNI